MSRRLLLFRLLLLLLTVLPILLLGELWARYLVPSYKKGQMAYDGGPLVRLHRYDPHLGWTGVPGLDAQYPGTRTVHVHHNSEGFRDSEPDPKDPRPIWAFLGDSFTWGYDVELGERYTDLLAKQRPDIRILNAGVSGYGTAQEHLLYHHHLRRSHPRVVVLLFGGNDRADNQKAVSDAGYGVPHYLVRDGHASLESETIPRLIPEDGQGPRKLPFYRSHLWDHIVYRAHRMRRYVETDPTEAVLALLAEAVKADGARLAVAVEEADPGVVATCKKLDVPVLELGPIVAAGATQGPTHYAGHGGHWTPLGHRLVAGALGPLLEKVAAHAR